MWPDPQTNALERADFIDLLRRAAVAYDEPEYSCSRNYFGSSLGANLVQLTYPKWPRAHLGARLAVL